MKSLSKNFIVIILILVGISLAFALFANPFEEKNEISLSALVQDINSEKIERVTIEGEKLLIVYTDGGEAESQKEQGAALSETFVNLGVEQSKLSSVIIEQKNPSGLAAFLLPLSFILIPLLLFGLFFFFMFKQARAGVSQAFDFTKTKARLFGADGKDKERVSFKDVAGLKEAKEELEEIIDFLKHPKKYLALGAKIPRGVLLVGPPGTGKTLLARAVAAEAGVPFFSASGSEFIEMFVGVGSSRVRDLFSTAKKAGRSIIFIDELDAIGRTRGAGYGGGHDEREQTLNQILVEMDGFERDDARIVMAATNRPDVLDSALLRPGRFDRRIVLDLPDINDREAILKIHARVVPSSHVNFREVAERTPGFSGADLANLVNESAILAARRNKKHISQSDILESIDKVLLGPERKSHILSKKEKEITAYHEGGHALVAASLPGADPIRKVSIISRGNTGGYTLKLPAKEKYLRSKADFLDELTILMGGYAAERLIFKEITTGPSNDLKKASEIARDLVKTYGMSEKLGPVTFGEREEMIFLGRDAREYRNYSDEVASEIDKEVKTLLQSALKKAESILRKRRTTLAKVAKTLIKKETLEQEEFEKLIGKKRGPVAQW